MAIAGQLGRPQSPRHVGDYTGWVTVVGDPAPFGSGLRVTVEIEGERFDAWVYGSPRRRLVDRQAGELVYVQGERRPMISNVRRAQIRHVVGRFDDRCGRRLARGLAAVPNVVTRAIRAARASPSRRWTPTTPRCSPAW